MRCLRKQINVLGKSLRACFGVSGRGAAVCALMQVSVRQPMAKFVRPMVQGGLVLIAASPDASLPVACWMALTRSAIRSGLAT